MMQPSRKRISIVVLAFVLLLPAAARADVVESNEVVVGEEAPPPPPAPPPAAEPESKSGVFLGAAVTYSISQFPALKTPAGHTAYGDTVGFDLRGGYRFMDFFALEGVFEYGNEFEADSSFPDDDFPDRTASVNSEISTIGFWTNAKGILPLGMVEPYLSGGIGLLYADELTIAQVWEQPMGATAPVQVKLSESDGPVVFAGRVAGGIDFAITEHAGLFAEASYAMPTDDLSDFDYIAVHFGGRLTF